MPAAPRAPRPVMARLLGPLAPGRATRPGPEPSPAAISCSRRGRLAATLLTYADRLYLASYNEPPKPGDLLFPAAAAPPAQRSPVKRSRAAVDPPGVKPI